MKIYFAVGAREYLYLLLTCNVKNILVSFAYPDVFNYRKILKKNNIKLMVDSGAFTAWTKGITINIDEYIKHIEENIDIIDREMITNLDVIKWGERGSKPTAQDYEDGAREGWENYLYMKSKGYESMPVFHQGENYYWLEKMAKNCKRIGISHNKDSTRNKIDAWLYQCFYILNELKTGVKTHGYGITSPDLISKYPYDTVDSASWALVAAWGAINTPYGKIVISEGKDDKEAQEKRMKEVKYIENCPEYHKQKIIEYINSFGFSLRSVKNAKNGYKQRVILNIMNVFQLEEKISNSGIIFSPKQKPLFDFLESDRNNKVESVIDEDNKKDE